MNDMELITENFNETERASRGIARLEIIKGELIDDLTTDIERLDILIKKRRKEREKAPLLAQKIALIKEMLILEDKRDFLRLTLFEREDIITNYFNARIQVIKDRMV